MEKAGRFLKQAGMMRDLKQWEKGDYNCIFEVTEEELITFIEPAHKLIERINKLIQA